MKLTNVNGMKGLGIVGALCVVGLALLLGGKAWAGKGGQGGDHPCRADAERLCKGVKPGEGRIRECMKKNEAKLSEACKDKIEKRKQHRGAVRSACQADAGRLCPSVGRGVIRCLRHRGTEVSQGCRDAFFTLP